MEKKKIYCSMSEFEKAYVPNRYKNKLEAENNRNIGPGKGLIKSVLDSIRKEL